HRPRHLGHRLGRRLLQHDQPPRLGDRHAAEQRLSRAGAISGRETPRAGRASRRTPMDFELSPLQRQLQARARALAETHMAARAAEIDRTEAYPWDHVERLGAAGFVGMTIPKRLGGQGLGYFEAVLVIEEMAKHCGAAGRIVVETNMGAIGAILKYGTSAQQ